MLEVNLPITKSSKREFLEDADGVFESVATLHGAFLYAAGGSPPLKPHSLPEPRVIIRQITCNNVSFSAAGSSGKQLIFFQHDVCWGRDVEFGKEYLPTSQLGGPELCDNEI